jgi:hypothetical protein
MGLVSDNLSKVNSIPPELERQLTHYSESCANGLPPPFVLDTYDFQHGRDDPLARVPPNIRFRRKLSQVLTTSAVEIGRSVLSADPGSVIESMIRIFSLQLTN